MNLVRKLIGSPLAASLLISTLVFLSILCLRSTRVLESLELTAYDWYIRLQKETPAPDSPIVLIKITENDIRRYGWPLTDATMAQTLAILTQYQAFAIGQDIYRDIPVPPGSKELDAILKRNRHIINTMKFGNDIEARIPPPPVLKNTDQVGFNDILVDPGGIVRRGLLFLDDGKTTAYSFALRLALLYLEAKGIRPQADESNPLHIRLGETTIRPFEANDGGYVNADARGYQFLIDFKDAKGSFLYFPLANLLSGEIDPELIKGKIVLIGVAAEGVKDFFYTPYSRGLRSGQQISGIELHAHIISQLLRFGLEGGSPISTMSEWAEGFWILLWSVMGGVMIYRVRSPWRLSLLALGGLLILSLVAYLAFLSGWWIPLVPPAMAYLISASVITAYVSSKEKKERASLMRLFSRHVSSEIAEAIWQQRDQFLDGRRPRSQKLIVTVMFIDLEGFTFVAEKMNPQALIDWLNTYLEAMAQLVIGHGGIIDEYTGDGLKADFGAPLPRSTEAEISQDALNAANCAIAMEREIKRLNTFWQEHNLPTVNMRIGVFTGPVVAGSLGSAQRLKYTTIGDTVNIASGLEGFDKDIVGYDFTNSPCRILIGESTLSYLGNQFRTQKVGYVSLKGRAQKINIYCLAGREDRHSSKQ